MGEHGGGLAEAHVEGEAAAVGRGVEHTDMPTVRAIARRVQQNDNRFSSIVLEIVRSPQFQMRVKAADQMVAAK